MNRKEWCFTLAAALILTALAVISICNKTEAAVYDSYGYDDDYGYDYDFDDFDDDYEYDGQISVHIDLSAQWLTVQEDGVVIFEAPVVTGTAGTSRATPTGTYSIYSKETCQVLRGADYASYVDYWMPFNGGIGMHDASWRSDDEYAYGGETYLWNGSHGCINMRYDDAATVYSLVSVGDSVIVTE